MHLRLVKFRQILEYLSDSLQICTDSQGVLMIMGTDQGIHLVNLYVLLSFIISPKEEKIFPGFQLYEEFKNSLPSITP